MQWFWFTNLKLFLLWDRIRKKVKQFRIKLETIFFSHTFFFLNIENI